jgi:hypothetical protein
MPPQHLAAWVLWVLVVAAAAVGAIPSRPARYNASTAESTAYLAIASYCGAEAVTNWSCAACALAAMPARGTSVVYVADNASGLHAYVGHLRLREPVADRRDDALVVAFRGTDSTNIHNWIIDLMIGQQSPYRGCPGCAVHSGFYAAWMVLAGRVVDALDGFARAAQPPSPPILVTGHSLGSALATLAAYELGLGGYPVRAVTTFGTPRVGNDAFAAAYDAVVLQGLTEWAQMAAWQSSRLVADSEDSVLRGSVRGGGSVAPPGPPLPPSVALQRALERSSTVDASPEHCWSVQDGHSCGANVVRIVNASDLIVHLPPLTLGYRHPPREVWYSNGSIAAYVECSPVNGASRAPDALLSESRSIAAVIIPTRVAFRSTSGCPFRPLPRPRAAAHCRRRRVLRGFRQAAAVDRGPPLVPWKAVRAEQPAVRALGGLRSTQEEVNKAFVERTRSSACRSKSARLEMLVDRGCCGMLRVLSEHELQIDA